VIGVCLHSQSSCRFVQRSAAAARAAIIDIVKRPIGLKQMRVCLKLWVARAMNAMNDKLPLTQDSSCAARVIVLMMGKHNMPAEVAG
jgi:hypothetical protein